ncbi:DUF2795 domain-containing protein [Spirilliplanes yamanashiensis]|nr:DUF2795 domain-containing protein [Spirilliplanes yamanashiensis]MDP9818724.1 hypothetical protein [Spirilliplanes yamanashiensis]
MERGNTKHGPRLDGEMEKEVRGVVQGTAGGRAEEWKEAEPAGEDQPPATIHGGESGAQEELSRLGRHIGPSALPGDREALLASARTLGAPDDVLAALDRLPEGTTYDTVVEIWDALGQQV